MKYKSIVSSGKCIKKLQKSLMFLVMVFMCVLSINTSVKAERSDVDSLIYISEGVAEVNQICARANAIEGVRSDILVYTSSDGILSFSNKEYSKLTTDQKKEFMEIALLSTKESGMGAQTKNKVYNFIAEQDSSTSAAVKYLQSDTSADFVKASSWFKPFGSVAGIVMGFLALTIFMFIGLGILFDLAYLSLPPFQMLLEHGEDNSKPMFVSNEAYKTKLEADGSTEYKNEMSLYFKRKVPSIFIMAIALMYLISGQIYAVLCYLLDAFSGIFYV